MKKTTFVNSLLVSSLVWAEQSAILVKEAPLRDVPGIQATALVQLDKDTPITLLKRRGGWYQVETIDHQTGWVRLLEVRYTSESEARESNIAEVLKQTATMPTASGTTTGVRGLTEAESEANGGSPEASLEQVQSYIPTEETLNEFATEGELSTQEAISLPEQ